MITDIFGKPVCVGSRVAHVVRTGSHMQWQEKVVLEVYDDYVLTQVLGRAYGRKTKVGKNFAVIGG